MAGPRCYIQPLASHSNDQLRDGMGMKTWRRALHGRGGMWAGSRNPNRSYPSPKKEVLDTLTRLIWTRDAGTPGPPG